MLSSKHSEKKPSSGRLWLLEATARTEPLANSFVVDPGGAFRPGIFALIGV